MKATVETKQVVAKDTWLFEFALSKKVSYEAGQSFRLTLPRQGHRFFSIANEPRPNVVTTVTRKGRSDFKRMLFRLKAGDTVDVSSIAGVFTLPNHGKQNLVFIAGGIGITPFVSLIRHSFARRLGHRITLVYANPEEASAPFLKEFQSLEKAEDKFELITRFSKREGRVGKSFLKEKLPLTRSRLFYIAGPVAMVQELFDLLIRLGVKPDRIKTEEFTGYQG